MQRFSLSAIRQPGKSYVEFLRTAQLSGGVYRLPRGATDGQHPHGEEEIYYVLAGQARFVSGSDDVAVAAGDLLFVPAGEDHRFHSIKEDLELLVLFAPPEGAGK